MIDFPQLSTPLSEYPAMYTSLLLGLALTFGRYSSPAAFDVEIRAAPGLESKSYGANEESTRRRETVVQDQYVPLPQRPARTPMTSAEAQLHLHLAYREVVGKAPDSRTLSLLLAQWALETGRGENMWGFNFGGIKSRDGGAMLETQESYGTNRQQLAQRFRTYRNALEGACDYVQILVGTFPKAFCALHGGNAREFVWALWDSGYFTGNRDEYAHAIALLSLEYERTFRGIPGQGQALDMDD